VRVDFFPQYFDETKKRHLCSFATLKMQKKVKNEKVCELITLPHPKQEARKKLG
jgi:hypothetical protein